MNKGLLVALGLWVINPLCAVSSSIDAQGGSISNRVSNPFAGRDWKCVPTAQMPTPLEIPLWPGKPPNAAPDAGPGVTEANGRITNVGIPSLFVYPHTGGKPRRAILFLSGGGYYSLWKVPIANGAAPAFLPTDTVVLALKYRIRPPSNQVEDDALADVQRALRLARHHAKEWGINPDKIGVVGWSAGAHLALNLATHHDKGNPDSADPVERQSCRPDFVGLLSTWPDRQKIANFPITTDTPPMFIASARDDKIAPTAFSEEIEAACKTAGVPVHHQIAEKGGHAAFNLEDSGKTPPNGTAWPGLFWEWLQNICPP